MDKQHLRERIWDTLDESGEARFPFPPHNRIPNFAGTETAAKRLAEVDEWNTAETIKSNPDAPQRPVRKLALQAGKTVYMAVPRLRDEACFLRLDPDEIEDIDHATTIGGSAEVGDQIGPDETETIDLIVSGSVAVNRSGARVGKGEGYSDLEYAVLRELELVDDATPVATTVHDLQVVDEEVSVADHDVPMDIIATPTRLIRPAGPFEKPTGIVWRELSEERIEEIPVLRRFRP